ncbi:MAG: cell wall metabolism sensor histidine kinase WalK [Anaerolineae bacterium]|nr:cell wall metabolism sensor histidine kinase WalK [Anaerolineae bacterium]
MREITRPVPAKAQAKTLFVSLRIKLIAVLALLFIVAFATIFYWLDGFVTGLAMDNLRRDLLSTAQTAAEGIDGDAHQILFESGEIDNATYTQIADYLRLIKKTNPQASGVYTYLQLPDKPDQVQLVVSAALPPSAEGVIVSEKAGECIVPSYARPGLGEDYTYISEKMIAGLKTPDVENEILPDDYGVWLSGYAPIYNSKGEPIGAVGVDMCALDVVQIQQNIRTNTSIALGITLLALITVVGLVATGITRPVVELTRIADMIGLGNYEQDFSHLYSSKVQDEVNKLANVFELMAGKVYTREKTLKARVEQLEIMIDESKRDRQVSEIIDSDFFQDLQGKVNDMRARFKSQGSAEK